MNKPNLKLASPLPPRSPERQRLADAIARHKAAQERIARVRQAVDAHSTGHLYDVVERAEGAVAEAQRLEPARSVARMLGDPEPSGPSTDEARQALAKAQDDYDRTSKVRASLDQALREAREELDWSEMHVRNAKVKVFATDPAIPQLVDKYENACREARRVQRTLSSMTLLLPPGLLWESMPNRDLRDAEADPAWAAAVAALDSDADAPLPME